MSAWEYSFCPLRGRHPCPCFHVTVSQPNLNQPYRKEMEKISMKNFGKSIALCCLTAALLVPLAQAQLHDPGPRPTGTVPASGFCPDGNPGFRSKFPGASQCVDQVQPSDGNAQGAGNIIA